MASLAGLVRAGLLACALAILSQAGLARAAVIADSPALPLLGVPYIAAANAGCFPAAGVCIGSGSLTLTALQSSGFVPTGQDIVASARYSATLTTLGGTPAGSVELLGTVGQLVLGRTSDTQTGSWTTELVSMALSGPLLGHTLSLTLDPAHASLGTTSVNPLSGSDNQFVIGSFFDVFVQLSLDSNPPLTTTRGPIRAEATAVPEPGTLGLLAAAGLMLAGVRRRKTGRH